MDKRPKLEDVLPLPAGVKLRTRKFGASSVMPLVPVRIDDAGTVRERPQLTLKWEDAGLGLTVLLRDDPLSGRLVAEVYCSDPAKLNKASVSVAVIGRDDDQRKTIALDQPDSRTGGCRGSGDFGMLRDTIRQLGTDLGLLVFMLEP